MAELSPGVEKKARKIQCMVLNALADCSQVRVADLMGVHETTVHNLKGDKLLQMATLLAACGLKVVPQTASIYDEASIASLKHLAGIGLRVLPTHTEDDQ